MTQNQLAYKWFLENQWRPDISERMRRKFSYAVKSGKIKRQPCAACGDTKSEGHHLNLYKAVYSVLWLCRKHHLAAHFTRGEKWGTNGGH